MYLEWDSKCWPSLVYHWGDLVGLDVFFSSVIVSLQTPGNRVIEMAAGELFEVDRASEAVRVEYRALAVIMLLRNQDYRRVEVIHMERVSLPSSEMLRVSSNGIKNNRINIWGQLISQPGSQSKMQRV